MKTIKIIDLLNKIANGEEVPVKFTYEGYLWEYDVKNKMWFYYFGKDKNHRFDKLFYINQILNDKVEIIEEEKKIPEKLPIGLKQTKDGIFNTIVKDDIQYELNEKEEMICKKIHEIIDYLKSKGDE